MARPKKDNADYFSHDADMRNDPRVKALRRKFGLEGYAIWNMILEVLTDSDHFEYEWTELNIELLAGDFDIDPDLLEEVISYCQTIKLLEKEDGLIYSSKMKERFESLLNKRNRDRKGSKPKKPTTETPKEIVSDDENPQSKVKESKVKESKEEEISKEVFSFEDFWEKYPKKIAKKKCKDKFKKLSQVKKEKIKATLDKFISYKPFADYTHPNPETYLNQERWDDELEPAQTSTSNQLQQKTNFGKSNQVSYGARD